MTDNIQYEAPQMRVMWFEPAEIINASRVDFIPDTEVEDPFAGLDDNNW